MDWIEYDSIRPFLRTGDLVLFRRIPWKWSYFTPGGFKHLLGWISNAVIAGFQRWYNKKYDGFHEFIHCGVVVCDDHESVSEDGRILLAEVMMQGSVADAVTGKKERGFNICFLRQRIKEYQGRDLDFRQK